MFSVRTQSKAILGALLLTAVTALAQPTPVYPGYSVSLFVSGLAYPGGLVYRSANQDILVCQLNGNKVSSIDLATGVVSTLGVVAYPEHIAVGAKGMGLVYVTTSNGGGPVNALDSSGRMADSFLLPDSGHPDGMALDSSGNVYLANNTTKSIVKYAAGSNLTNPTTYASGFESLQGITFDTSGRLFAEDYSAGIVYYVTPGANTVWGTGIGSYYDSMLDIAYVPKLGILASTEDGTVSVIPSQGVVDTFATGFSSSTGIAVDSKLNIYIADGVTGSVWKFSPAAP